MTSSDYRHSIEQFENWRFGVGILRHVMAVCLGLSAATVTEYPNLPLQRLLTPFISLIGNIFQLPFDEAMLACGLGLVVLCEVAGVICRYVMIRHIRKLYWLTLGDDNQMYF